MKAAYSGHHKCASTFIGDVIRAAAVLTGRTVHTEFLSRRLPLGYELDCAQHQRIAAAYASLRDTPCPVVCHGNADEGVVEALVAVGGFRAFHVIRDPRDMLVSGYFWHRSPASVSPKHTLNGWNFDRRDRLAAARNHEEGLLIDMELSRCYFDTLSEWDFSRPDILETRYENLIGDEKTFFKSAFDFIGFSDLDDAALDGILDEHSFRRKSDGRLRGEERLDHKYSKGLAGDWRSHFTPRVADAFNRSFQRLLIRLDYEADDNRQDYCE